MISASRELQSAIYDILINDSVVLNVLGGPRIYDFVPRKVQYPYVAFGDISVRDWSTGDGDGEEHSITFHIWSRAAGRIEIYDIASALRSALHDRNFAMRGHRLVNFRHNYSETRRESDSEHFHGVVRFLAVTEPLS